MNPDIERILYTSEQISEKVKEIGKRISDDYRGKELLIVGTLNGAVPFTADLIRAIDTPLLMDFVGASSYGDTAVSGKLKMTKEPSINPKGKEVILVEDIIDTGKTLFHLSNYYKSLGAESVRIAAFLDKAEARVADIYPDYTGYVVANEFVVGYGLDYAQHYRSLPYIGVLKPEIYT